MRWSDCGGPPYNNPPYYLSAYGLAVKHGFKGTEEEYLASLKGDPREHRGRQVPLEKPDQLGRLDRQARPERRVPPAPQEPRGRQAPPEKQGQRDRQARQEKPEPQVPRGQWGPRDRQAAPPARQDQRGPADRPAR